MIALALGCTIALGLLLWQPAAWAQQGRYTLVVGVPAAYRFTKDQTTQQAPEAKSPSGLRLMLSTPINVGIGFASYQSGFADPNPPWAARDIKYSLLEVQYTVPISIVLLGLGIGAGSAEFTPVRASFGPIVQDFKKSPAREWYLMLGLMLGDSWDVRVAMHALVINAQLSTNGTESTGDLGAILTTVGAGYHF
jgi:hypothetical protein